MKKIALLLITALLLTACVDRQAQQLAQQQAEAAANEQAATELMNEYDKAVEAEYWEIAQVHGSALLSQYPQTSAATKIETNYQDVKAKAETAREQWRLAALWGYTQTTVSNGIQRAAQIDSKDAIDIDGTGTHRVQLIFRDHPEWQRSSYLILQTGDFNCAKGCRLKVSVDGGTARHMEGFRPDTDEAIAMFINDHKTQWQRVKQAQEITIEFPVRAGGTRSATFEVSGLDSTQMPGWD